MCRETQKVVYLGSIGNVYNLDTLLKAAYILKTEKIEPIIILVGSGTERERLELISLEMQLDNVFFVGTIPKNEVFWVLHHSDILYNSARSNPLYDYGTNITKMRDYFLSGVPVLSASNIKDDLVRLSGAGLLANPENPEEIAEQLKKGLSLSKKEKKEIGAKAKQYLLEHFSIEKIIDKLEKII
jgi:glycosyltransferase involved in cell wall biosynthesis